MTRTDAETRTVILTDPTNPLSLVSEVTTTALNGRNWEYDLDQMVTSEQRPDGSTIAHSVDSAGRLELTSIPGGAVAYRYYPPGAAEPGAAPGRLSSLLGPYGVDLSFSYDGQLTTSLAWSGDLSGSVAWEFDDNFLPTRETVTGPLSTSSIVFGYNRDLLLTCASPSTCSPAGADALRVTRRQDNGFVSQVDLGSVREEFGFSGLGELAYQTSTHSNSSLASFLYNQGAAPRDALGRVVQKSETLLGTTRVYRYVYDSLNRLRDVLLGGSLHQRFEYDLNGNRLSTFTSPGGTVTSTYDELDGTGNLIAQYVYGSSAYAPDAMIRDGKQYRILADHLASPHLAVNVVDSTDIPFRAQYSAFGEVSGTNLDFLPIGFAGGLYDPDTGLVRFGARDYDPSIGRWMSKDPIRFDGGVNLYAYANADPVNFVDRDGRIPIALGGVALAGPLGWAAIGLGLGIVAIIGVDIIANDNGDNGKECRKTNEDPLANTCTYQCQDGSIEVIPRELPGDIADNMCPTNDVEVCPPTMNVDSWKIPTTKTPHETRSPLDYRRTS